MIHVTRYKLYIIYTTMIYYDEDESSDAPAKQGAREDLRDAESTTEGRTEERSGGIRPVQTFLVVCFRIFFLLCDFRRFRVVFFVRRLDPDADVRRTEALEASRRPPNVLVVNT